MNLHKSLPTLVLAAAVLSVNSGCSPSRADELNGSNRAEGTTGTREIASSQLSGTFDNKPFILSSAIAKRIVANSGEQIMITFAPAGSTLGCGTRYPLTYIGASAPAKIGSYSVNFEDQVKTGVRPEASTVFTKVGETTRALVASTTTVRVDSISATEVRGGLSAQAQDGPNTYDASGEFTATICD